MGKPLTPASCGLDIVVFFLKIFAALPPALLKSCRRLGDKDIGTGCVKTKYAILLLTRRHLLCFIFFG